MRKSCLHVALVAPLGILWSAGISTPLRSAGHAAAWPRLRSVSLGDEFHPAQAGLIIVASLLRTLRQPDLVPAHALIWDHLQKMRDAIQPRPPFIVGTDDMPGCMLRMGRLEHHVARPGIIVPASIRFGIHLAQLQLPQRILDQRLKAALLFVHPY